MLGDEMKKKRIVVLLIFLAVVSGGIYFAQGKNELTERIVTPQQKNKIVLDVPLESQFDDVAFEVAHDTGEVTDVEAGVLGCRFVAEGFESFNRCAGAVLAA